jgi:hypothetical protein
LVTAKSSGTLTVQRGYAGTPRGGPYDTGYVLLKNPLWTRQKVRNQILRGLRGTISATVPRIKTATVEVPSTRSYVEVPLDALRVLEVGYLTNAGRWRTVNGWQEVSDLPSVGIEGVASGRLLTLPSAARTAGTDLFVKYQAPYEFWTTDPTEEETVDLFYSSEDLPPLYAAAFLVAGREISRLELNKVEEWNREEMAKAGVNVRTVAQLWQQFYRRVDEVRKLQVVPRHRPYRKMR